MSDTFAVPNGLVCITTHGSIQAQTAQCLWEMRSFTEKQGATNIRYATIPGGLVDKARNDACRAMMATPEQWLLFIDGDMTFSPDALMHLLTVAYKTHPWADVVGAYCVLRGDLAIPTIDTGTGTWESHFPGEGVIEVIRTGGAFLLVKRHVCERLPQPWFATRVPMRPLDAMHELDNFARIKFDGTNPFRETPAWGTLEEIARQDDPRVWTPSEVGEDSGFCDKVRAAGMRIVVHTSVTTGHLGQTTFDWTTHKKAMDDRDREQRLLCGIVG